MHPVRHALTAALAAATLTLSCASLGPPPNPIIRVSTRSWSYVQMLEWHRAITRISRATGLELALEYGECRSYGEPWCAQRVTNMPGIALGYTDPASMTILVHAAADTQARSLIIVHELLHRMGVGHRDGGGSAMGEDTGIARDCISQWEIDELCSMWYCGDYVTQPETCPE